MTFEEDYQELIYAYAFGCLDLDEQSKFIDQKMQDPDFKWSELGEYQNLASLLPSILTIENPEDEVKSKVAKKLYSYKDEIRIKKKRLTVEQTNNETENQETIEKKVTKKAKPETVEEAEETGKPKEELIKENIKSGTEEIEVVTSDRKTKDLLRPSQSTQIKGRDLKSILEKKRKTTEDKILAQEEIQREEIKLEEEKPAEKKKKSAYVPYTERKTYKQTKSKNYSPVIILLFLIMISGFLWIYFSTSSKISKLNKEVDRLTYQVSGLTASLKKNVELQDILTTKNVRIVNLSPTRLGKKGYGKLIISFDKNKGFFQMFNMSKIEKNKSYQLWVNVSRSYFSLGVFTPQKNSEYYSFKLPQLSGKQTIRFLVSKETKLGAERPGKLIYLRGRF